MDWGRVRFTGDTAGLATFNQATMVPRLLTFARSALGSLLGNNNCLTALMVPTSHPY